MRSNILLLNLLATATSASMAADIVQNNPSITKGVDEHEPSKNVGLRGWRNLKGRNQGQQKRHGSNPVRKHQSNEPRDRGNYRQGQNKQHGSKPDKNWPSSEPPAVGGRAKNQLNRNRKQPARNGNTEPVFAGPDFPTQPPIDDTSQRNNANAGRQQGRQQAKNHRAKMDPKYPKMKLRKADYNKQNKQGKYVQEDDGTMPMEESKTEKGSKNQRGQDAVGRANPAPVVTNAPTFAPVTPEPTLEPTLKPTTAEPTSHPTIEPTSYPTLEPTLNPVTFEPTFMPTTDPTAVATTYEATTYEPTLLSSSYTYYPTWSPTTVPTTSAELEEVSDAEGVLETLTETQLEACPPAYDTSKTTYVGGDFVDVDGYIFQCHTLYSTYCNIAEWDDVLLDDNENAKEFWNSAWTLLGPCETPKDAESLLEEVDVTDMEEEATEAVTADGAPEWFSYELSSSSLLKYQVHEGISITMEVIYDGDDAAAWLGIAFSETGGMVGSEAVIGIPGANTVQKYNLGGKNVASIEPMSSDHQTLIDASIEVDEYGQTIMKFTKLLVEDGEIEIVSSGGREKNIFLFAHGSDGGDGLGYHGGDRMTFDLTL